MSSTVFMDSTAGEFRMYGRGYKSAKQERKFQQDSSRNSKGNTEKEKGQQEETVKGWKVNRV